MTSNSGNMKSVAGFDHCFGCGVCAAVCPHQAISMQMNAGGFFSPVVSARCTGCSLCLKHCAFHAKKELTFSPPMQSLAGWSLDEQVRDRSTSGGVVYELCKHYINKGYQICAVLYNYEQRRTEHFLFDSLDDLKLATGSKYIQSDSCAALSQLDWKNGRYVIIGTPCMIASVKSLVRARNVEDRVLLVDFFCHGVPSYLMWHKYLQHVQDRVGQVKHISWRNKDNGWQDSTAVKAVGDKGRYLSFLSHGDLFFEFFLRDRCLNECCYDDCVFKRTHSCADIRVGDLWSPKREFVGNRLGVNSILLFSHRAKKAIEQLTDIETNEVELDIVLRRQLAKNPKRSAAYNYVNRAFAGNVPLSKIGKRAKRLEKIHQFTQRSYYKDLFLRLLRKN